MSVFAKSLRLLAVVAVAAAATLMATVPVAGQTADEGPTLPDSFLEDYGWWSKLQQNPAGGRNPDVVPGCSPYVVATTLPPTTSTIPTDPSTRPAGQCPVGPPADGLYIAYDYETVTPTAVSGAVGNAPTTTSTTIVFTPPDPRIPPPPPVHPPDQVLGPTAYSAVRYVVPEGAETSLTLNIINRPTTTPGGADPTAGVRVLACQTNTRWTGITNERYDQGPKWDQSSCAVGDMGGDQLTFTFPASMAEEGYIDVAIVPSFGDCPDPPVETPPPPTTTLPGQVPGGLVPSPPRCDHAYQLAFAKPLDYSLSVDSVPEDEDSEAMLEEDYLFEDPLLDFDEDFFDDGALDPDSAFADFDFAGAGVDNYGAIANPPVGRPVVARAVPTSGFRNPFRPDASRGERLLAVSLLLALGAALWWFGGQQLRAPRLLGSLGAAGIPIVGDREREKDTNGGLGRFIRPRSGRPPRLF